MASTRQNIAPFIMIVAWLKVPLLQKEWVPCWMWLKCDWTWLKYSWLISIRMWLLSIKIPLQSISITINQDQSLQEFSDVIYIESVYIQYAFFSFRSFIFSLRTVASRLLLTVSSMAKQDSRRDFAFCYQHCMLSSYLSAVRYCFEALAQNCSIYKFHRVAGHFPYGKTASTTSTCLCFDSGTLPYSWPRETKKRYKSTMHYPRR